MTAETAIFAFDATTIDLTGTWRLVETTREEDGVVVDPENMGPDPRGLIHYLPDNRVSVILARGDRQRMSTDRHSPPAEERAAAWTSFNAYAGSYTRLDDVVVHHIELNSYENDTGADYVRRIEIIDADLVLCTEPVSRDGRSLVFKLRWTRV